MNKKSLGQHHHATAQTLSYNHTSVQSKYFIKINSFISIYTHTHGFYNNTVQQTCHTTLSHCLKTDNYLSTVMKKLQNFSCVFTVLQALTNGLIPEHWFRILSRFLSVALKLAAVLGLWFFQDTLVKIPIEEICCW